MYECLNLFSGPTRAWFKHAFDVPTAAQSQAWPVIHAGGNALVVAPTGSGKTLCAFLSAIDRLMTGEADRLNGSGAMTAPKGAADVSGERRRTRRVKVLYVSPLKALAVDVAKNLRAPLDGIAAECEASGLAAPDIGIAIRSGDTTTRERRAIASHPPDILVTTPESLYLLLTSKARVILRDVETVILDEVHAVAGTKRGAHLAVSLERLDALAGHATQRIGLSATVRPVDEVARFVGGIHPVTVINPQERPAMDLRVVEPLENMRDLQSANVPGRAGGVGASARLLAAFCQLSDVSADCIGSEEGAVAILRNLDGDGPEVAARDLTIVVSGMSLVLAVNRADKLEATVYLQGKPGQTIAPPLLFTSTAPFVEDLLLGITDEDGLIGTGMKVEQSADLDHDQAMAVIAEHTKFGRGSSRIE